LNRTQSLAGFEIGFLSFFLALICINAPERLPRHVGRGVSNMSMLKVIEVLCESDECWEDAARSAVANAAETIRNVRSIYIENFEATVEQNKIKSYRINAKITFLLE
jgi:flavin-binding protein dodecin